MVTEGAQQGPCDVERVIRARDADPQRRRVARERQRHVTEAGRERGEEDRGCGLECAAERRAHRGRREREEPER